MPTLDTNTLETTKLNTTTIDMTTLEPVTLDTTTLDQAWKKKVFINFKNVLRTCYSFKAFLMIIGDCGNILTLMWVFYKVLGLRSIQP